MKKIILLLLLVVPFVANAQSYILTKKTVLDKFDDVLLERNQKTIVTKTDSTFVIEEKGKEPVTYVISEFVSDFTVGNKDNIVNLVENLYGYEEWWCVTLSSDYEAYRNEYLSCSLETDEDKRMKDINKIVDKYCYYINRRVVTTQYTHRILGQYFCIRKRDNKGVATMYSKITN